MRSAGSMFAALAILSACASGPLAAGERAPVDDLLYTRPQRLVDLGGARRMNLYCTGRSAPTVILDAGLSDPNFVWAYVQPGLARKSRVCSYDRAGIGFSDPSSRPGTSGNIADDLHALLNRAGVQPPYVLVGHSFGGMNVRVFADRHPTEILGMVLIDPAHEDQAARLRAVDDGPDRKRQARIARHRECSAAAAVGFAPGSELFRKCIDEPLAAFGPKINATLARIQMQPSFQLAQLSEVENIDGASSDEARAERRSFGGMPIIVLSSGVDPATLPESARSAHDLAQWSMDAELAALSTRGIHRAVEGSGHYIQIDEPAAVISAVVEVIDAACGEHKCAAGVGD